MTLSTKDYDPAQAQGAQIPTATIADSAVTADKIADATITQAKLASDNLIVKKVALTAGEANAFAFAWENPESSQILVDRVIMDITTAGGTATSVIDVGPATGATGTADTVLDGVDANSTGVSDSLNATDNGTNGTGKAFKLDENGGTTAYLTGKILVEEASSLVGNVYIYYRTV